MFENIGGSKTFRIFGICSLVLFVIHVLIQKSIKKSDKGKLQNLFLVNIKTIIQIWLNCRYSTFYKKFRCSSDASRSRYYNIKPFLFLLLIIY